MKKNTNTRIKTLLSVLALLLGLFAFIGITNADEKDEIFVAPDPVVCNDGTVLDMPSTENEPWIYGTDQGTDKACNCSINYETIYYNRDQACMVGGYEGTQSCTEKWQRSYYTTPWYCPSSLFPCPPSELKLLEKVCGDCNSGTNNVIETIWGWFW